MATASQNARSLDSPPPAGGGGQSGNNPSGAPTVAVGGGSFGQPPAGQDAPIAGGVQPSVVSSQDNADAFDLSPDKRYRIGNEVYGFSDITGALVKVPELQSTLSQYQQELQRQQQMFEQLGGAADDWKYWYELASKNDFSREYLMTLDNGKSEDEAIAAAMRTVPGGKLPTTGIPPSNGHAASTEFVPPPGSQPGDPEFIAAKLEFMERDQRSFRSEVMDILRRVPEEAAARLAPRVDQISNRFAQEDQYAQAEQAFERNAEYNEGLVDQAVGQTLYTELGLDLSMLPANEVAAINQMAYEELGRYGVDQRTIGQGQLNPAVLEVVSLKVLNRYQQMAKPPSNARLPINPSLNSNPVPGQGAANRGRFGPNMNSPSARARALERR